MVNACWLKARLSPAPDWGRSHSEQPAQPHAAPPGGGRWSITGCCWGVTRRGRCTPREANLATRWTASGSRDVSTHQDRLPSAETGRAAAPETELRSIPDACGGRRGASPAPGKACSPWEGPHEGVPLALVLPRGLCVCRGVRSAVGAPHSPLHFISSPIRKAKCSRAGGGEARRLGRRKLGRC